MNKYLLSLVFLFQFLCDAQILDRDTIRYQTNDVYLKDDLREHLSKHRSNISSLTTQLRDFQTRFNQVDSAKTKQPDPVPQDTYEPNFLTSEQSTPPDTQSVEEKLNVFAKSGQDRKLGFYILPFVALQSPGDFEFQSRLGPFDIEQDMGFATGWRLGVESTHFFIDGEFSYIRNKFNSLSNGLVSFTGEVENFGLLINTGGKVRISSNATIYLGAGFGAMNQEIGFDLNSIIREEEESTLFSYQLFTGVNFDVSNNLRVGLRYRWMRVGEMELFSARDLHLAELSLGYVF